MPRFRFELESLLQLRRQQEHERQTALAALAREKAKIEDDLRRQDALLRADRHSLRSDLVGAINVTLVRQHAVAALSGQRKAQQAVLKLAGLQRKIDQARAEVVAASRKRRALELLRERRWVEWKRSLDKREQAELDEIGGTRIAPEFRS